MQEIHIEQIGADGGPWPAHAAGAIGELVCWHGRYYREHAGFDQTFEAEVARDLGAFVLQFDAKKDGFWVAWKKGDFAGAMVLKGGMHPHPGPRLRWFLVPPKYQGCKLGSRLMDAALAFAHEGGHSSAHLWTIAGLDAALRLYERRGFVKTRSFPSTMGGKAVTGLLYQHGVFE